MLRYKLVASDFDGTLRHSDGSVSQNTKAAIDEFTAAGGIFAMCTGRMASSILPYARELGLQGLAAAYQGGMICDIKSGAMLRDLRIPWEDAAEMCRFLEGECGHIHVYDGDVFYANADDGFLAMYERVCRVRGVRTPRAISAVVSKERIAANKLVAMCDAAERDRLFARCMQAFGERFYVTSSMEQMVEIAPKGADKGCALEFLAEHYNIPLAETMGVGDNYNDLPLIRKAGLGVAIGNAVPALKEAAGFVSATCDEDGVAFAIRKFALGGEE